MIGAAHSECFLNFVFGFAFHITNELVKAQAVHLDELFIVKVLGVQGMSNT